MTAPELADALAEQRAAHRPDRIPLFSELVDRKRRRDRRRRVAAGSLLAGAVVAVGLAVAPMTAGPDDAARDRVATGPEAAVQPDAQRLREAFAPLASDGSFFDSVQTIPAGELELGDRPRRGGEGVVGETPDRTTSVSWSVVTPALTETEVVAMAGSIGGSRGVEQGVPVPSTADQTAALRSVAYRYGDGSFVAIWAWSSDGGVVTLTSGIGATTTDDEIRAWESAARSLLGPPASPAPLDVNDTPAGNRWWLATPPRPDDRALDLVVHERACASGQSADGRIRPVVEYRPDSILVTITVPYAGGFQLCPGNPDTPFRLPLDEPVGDREILDGRSSPPGRALTSKPGDI